MSTSVPLDIHGNPITGEFDFIVVGGGSAGCIVASRLSEYNQFRVLLIEAGDSNQVFKVRSPFITCPTLQNSEFDWAYRTEPQALQRGRRSHWPRGKTLGGSSSINFMLYVRPDPKNFTEWVNNHGCQGWSYDEVLPFMKKSENFVGSKFDAKTRGKGGPITVSDLRDMNHLETGEILDAFVKGGKAAGIEEAKDYNSDVQDGITRSQANIKEGSRCDTASAFLFSNGAITRKNLTILVNAHVTQITTVGNTATGVAVVINPGNKLDQNTKAEEVPPAYVFKAKREVILSAGAIGTPHILMLSGIGPKEELEKVSIPVCKDLPGVGKNMKDHVMLSVIYGCKPGVSNGFYDKNPLNLLSTLFNYFAFGQGICTTTWVQGMAFFKSKQREATASNDLQIHAIPFVTHDPVLMESHMGLKYPDHGPLMDVNKMPTYGFTFLPSLLQPYSAGYIKLKSANPFQHPIIEPAYMVDNRDVEALVDCYKACRQIAKSKEMSRFLDKEFIDPEIPHAPESEEYMRERVKRDIITIYHPTTTCKMGPKNDPMNVTDHTSLKVYGFNNLRIADCSVCPDIVSANTNAVAFLIGEKCADFILKDHNKKASL